MNIEQKAFITKKELCILLGLHNETLTRFYYHRLRDDYFNDSVLKEMKLNRDEFRKIRRFNRKQTAFIYSHFKDDFV